MFAVVRDEERRDVTLAEDDVRLREGPWPVWLAARMPSGGLDQPQHPPHGVEVAVVSPESSTEAEPLTSL